MSAGEPLEKRKIDASQHFTEPPPRYSEASLVKRMEELGIGRPSTYASILQVLKDRGYVRIDKKRLVPEDKGRVLTAFLESFFARYVEYGFTADLEEQLDRISNNELAWQKLLRDFWRDFTAAVGDIKELRVAQVIDALDEMLSQHLFPPRADGTDPRACPHCGTAGCRSSSASSAASSAARTIPECRYTRQLATSAGANGAPDGGMKKLGEDPETGLEVTLRSGRFGPYVQLGEAVEGEKPKRAGIPRGVTPDDVDLQRALGLLSLPREVGVSPEDGEPILAGIGRFGPYIQHGKTYANLETGDDVLTIGLNRAVTLIAEKKAKGPGKGRFGADPGRSIGDHPERRRGAGEEGPLRPLRQPRRRQRHAARRQDAGDDHARRGARAAGSARGARRRQAAGQAAQRTRARPRRRRAARRSQRQPKPKAKAKPRRARQKSAKP